jgi:hypothetical protein
MDNTKSWFQKINYKQHRNIYFLLALTFLFTASAFSYNLKSHEILEDIGISLVAITAIYSFYTKRHHLYFGIFLALIIIVTNWLDQMFQGYVVIVKIFFTLFFFTYILILSLIKLFASKSITLNSIIGVINGFIVLGIIAGSGLLVISRIWPDAFVFSYNEPYTFLSYIYFGFVTITTLGFGDIVPVTPPGQLGIIIFSIVGQMYLATIIASFIGKYSAISKHSDEK